MVDMAETGPNPEISQTERILSCPVGENEANAGTVREYFVNILTKMWTDPETDGKRPFGDSNWQNDIYTALGREGIIECHFDEDGDLDGVDPGADRVILEAIQSLRGTPPEASSPHEQ